MAKRDCPLCGELLEDEPAIHDVVVCEKTELLKGRETIKTLKASVESWRDAWYHQREIIGQLSWTHHKYVCPHETKVEELPPVGWKPTADDLALLAEDPRIKLDSDLGTEADEKRGLERL